MLKFWWFVEVVIYLLEKPITMKRVLLSMSLIVLGSSLSFGQKQENIENKPEIKKVKVEAVKAKKVKKAEKHEKIKVEGVQTKKVTRKESTELKGKKED